MPRPTESVKQVSYADDLTVWATGIKIPDLEDSINSYIEEINANKVFSHVVQPGPTPSQDLS